MDLVTLRAWWWSQQRVGAMTGEAPRAALAATGWVRSVAGASPYLALFARAGSSREEVDRAVAAQDVCELPAVRGCTYVVPADDYALALRAGQGFGDAATMAMARKHLGVTDAEIDALCAAVCDALDQAPCDPAQLKERLGGAVRSLGAEGKKRGTTTTLPIALGRLQSLGEIRRVPVNGRLDQQRYRYARWSPVASNTWTDEALAVALVERFWQFAGPARFEEFTAWSGLGVKVARAALASLGYVAVTEGSPWLASPELAARVRAFAAPREPSYALLGSLDNVVHLRRELAPLVDDADAARVRALAGGLSEAPHHVIVDRHRLVGFWDYDVDASELVWSTFSPATDALRAAIDRAERCVRDELGDARAFSLDAPGARGERLDALRAMKKKVAR